MNRRLCELYSFVYAGFPEERGGKYMKRRLFSFVLAVMMVVAFSVPTAFAATPKVSSLKLSKSSVTLSPNKSVTLKVTISPKTASRAVRWTVSHKDIISVNSKGVVTAKANGKSWVAATAKDGSKKKARALITVRTLASSVSLSDSSVALDAGKTVKLVATVLPGSTSNKGLIWASSDAAVASVDQSGIVTGAANGVATITATTKDGSKKIASATVTVTTPVTGLSVTSNKMVFSVTDTALTAAKVVSASVVPASASNQKLVWTLEGPSAAKFVLSSEDASFKAGEATSVKSVKVGIAPNTVLGAQDAATVKVKAAGNTDADEAVSIVVLDNVVPAFSTARKTVGLDRGDVSTLLNSLSSYVRFETDAKTGAKSVVVDLSSGPVSANMLADVKKYFGGTSIPVAVEFSAGTPAGLVRNADFDDAYLIWVNLDESMAKTHPQVIDMTSGAVASYNHVVRLATPVLTLEVPSYNGRVDTAVINQLIGMLVGEGKAVDPDGAVLRIDGDLYNKALESKIGVGINEITVAAAINKYLGGKIPFAVDGTGFEPVGLTENSNWNNEYLQWLDAADFQYTKDPVKVELTNKNGTVSSYSRAVSYETPSVSFGAPYMVTGTEVATANAFLASLWDDEILSNDSKYENKAEIDGLYIDATRINPTFLDELKAVKAFGGNTLVPVLVTGNARPVSATAAGYAYSTLYAEGTGLPAGANIMWIDLNISKAYSKTTTFVNQSGMSTSYYVEAGFEDVYADVRAAEYVGTAATSAAKEAEINNVLSALYGHGYDEELLPVSLKDVDFNGGALCIGNGSEFDSHNMPLDPAVKTWLIDTFGASATANGTKAPVDIRFFAYGTDVAVPTFDGAFGSATGWAEGSNIYWVDIANFEHNSTSDTLTFTMSNGETAMVDEYRYNFSNNDR